MKLPVYLFNGFLESGKTRFVKEILADPIFTDGEKSLLIVCEEGLEEYEPEFLEKCGVTLESIEDAADFTTAHLERAAQACKPDRVIIEYNGMWDFDRCVNEVLPADWELFQVVVSVCGPTFELYSANMGPKMFEHITTADMIVFNRCTQADKDYLHQRNIRAMNPRATIFLDDVDGNSEDYRENMLLPFDLDADVIDISDMDYGLWYVDASGEPGKYEGKTVRFKAMALVTDKLPFSWFVPGRFGMVCCAEDITYIGFACKGGNLFPKVRDKQWFTFTASIHVENLEQYRGEGPVLDLISIEPAEKPEDEIVYFS